MTRFLSLAAFVAALALLVVPSVPLAQMSGASELHAPPGFTVEVIARLARPRELAVAPNGDLLAGTLGRDVMLVPSAQGTPQPPRLFAEFNDAPAAGVALADGALYIGTQFGVWRVPYRTGDLQAREAPVRIAQVRPSGIARDHRTTSLAIAGARLYASVGSSCDACDPELDATRATIQEMGLDGSDPHPRAVRIRNAVALATDPATGALWAVVNGQDQLERGQPYEIGDAVTSHPGVADYGWPHRYDDRRPVQPGADCAHVTVPSAIFPAYNAPLGAAVYPATLKGRYAFPQAYAGGLFVALHGSWHQPPVPPRVVFLPLEGDTPKTPPNWNEPTTQWREFLGGFQLADGSRIGRPSGVAVGTDGSLFVSDDAAGAIYRIRPAR